MRQPLGREYNTGALLARSRHSRHSRQPSAACMRQAQQALPRLQQRPNALQAASQRPELAAPALGIRPAAATCGFGSGHLRQFIWNFFRLRRASTTLLPHAPLPHRRVVPQLDAARGAQGRGSDHRAHPLLKGHGGARRAGVWVFMVGNGMLCAGLLALGRAREVVVVLDAAARQRGALS